ncbi:hypothetical protein ALC62_14527, partial [Cyphomyrmex costatus]
LRSRTPSFREYRIVEATRVATESRNEENIRIGWVVERRMVEVEEVRMAREDGFSIPPSGKPHLAGDTHAKQEDGVLYHTYVRPRKHEGVLLLLRTTHADKGVLEVGAPTRERENST